VSRLLCSPESPTFAELSHFLEMGSPYRALRKDPDLNHLHWATTRRAQAPALMALALDDRQLFDELADANGLPRDRAAAFAAPAIEAVASVAKAEAGFGVVLDASHGPKALYGAAAYRLFIGRSVERPGSRPLDFDGPADLGSHLAEFPVDHTIKASCLYHPDDEADLKSRQERELCRLHDAARGAGRELLIAVTAGRHGRLEDDTVAAVLARLYALGIKPDWWQLEPQPRDSAWAAIETVVKANDPYCRGVLLGLDASEAEAMRAFGAAARSPLVKGFVARRPVLEEAARAWFAGRLDDEAATAAMAQRLGRLVGAWRDAACVTAARMRE
jgi:5-dehydro-2-deoxygluconokinase